MGVDAVPGSGRAAAAGADPSSRLPDIDLYRQVGGVSHAAAARASSAWAAHVESLARTCPGAGREMLGLTILATYLCRVVDDGEVIARLNMDHRAATGPVHGHLRIAIDHQEAFPSFLARVARWAGSQGARDDVAQDGDDRADIVANTADSPIDNLVVSIGAMPAHAPVADIHFHIDVQGMLECRAAPDIDTRYPALLVERLEALACSIALEPARPLVLQELMSAAERAQVVATWNATDVDYDYGGGLVAMFERAASAAPGQPALIYKDEALSFEEFNSRVNRLARMLVARGVGKDDFVCLCMERSVEMVVAIWAILKAGGAYVPLNTEDPVARIGEIILDCAPRAIIGQEKFAAALEGHAAIYLGVGGQGIERVDDGNLGISPAPTALAYMIYTSGSTGKPKGVTIEHAAIHNRVVWMHREYGLSPSERVLQKTPYTFDVSVWEFLWSFAVGSTLVVAEPGGHSSIRYMRDLIRDRGVTHLHFVPSMLRLFLMLPTLKELPIRKLFCSGEALGADSVASFHAKANDIAEVHNLYGPTEAAVDVSYFHCPRDAAGSVVPIGRPVANTGLYVLDAHGQPCPVGIPGELHIGGIQLARGYWKREDLTAERFVACAIRDIRHTRLYRTGDLACFRRDGEILYLGRNDFQVKISGVRIEPGEIEAVIRGDDSTQDVVVVAEQHGGNKVLVAYVVSTDPGGTRADALRQRVAAACPATYVPREVRFLKRIPLTVSGKVDRKLLADATPA